MRRIGGPSRHHKEHNLHYARNSDRSLGFFGKSAIHPSQLPTIHAAFAPYDDELQWAREVIEAFDNANGAALRLPGGEFVDLPVAERARKILRLAESFPS
jgi:citrate lyase subunit beta / citryl-CoA lyase